MTFKINIIDVDTFEEVLSQDGFLSSLKENVYIVKQMFSPDTINFVKSQCEQLEKLNPASWNPCVDHCPDYHRKHYNYPKAYVKSIQHAYYFHRWNGNCQLFSTFYRIFEWKAKLAESSSAETYLSHVPSDGPIARIVVHHYPKGGGGQEEHIDPESPYARIQTIVQASVPGRDFSQGGLYINSETTGKAYLDGLTIQGDLIVMSPAIKHGVESIHSEQSLDWESKEGRWIIMPIIINSDVNPDEYGKPQGLGKQ
ncbi:hypothetical protein CA267_014305 [Alteromonas pelagimontana]|uniref:Fe2OG dioxygenase domain-containing protein n=1 Tax=Alteromonas pelagimontana TaxID=1858656 RepID=A0A6M4MFV9_9ALTE|nr:hypothetical protein [Alteromonas pelagimontana]QJR81847.1 hypothetical protein CA267_014305 [Alteromonas pelagimontana]